MNSGVRVWLLTGLAGVTVAPALAQGTQTADAPPAVLQIYREEVKPGKDAAHEANEAGWPAAAAKAKLTNHYLGMTSMTGPSEAWFVSGYASWEEWEKATKAGEANEAYSAEVKRLWAQDGEFLSRSSGIVASYRPAMSYRAQRNLAARRYMQMMLIRVKPGYGREFEDARREVVAAHEKAKMQDAFAVYEVVSGMPSGTYLLLQTMTSLAERDQFGPTHNADAYRDALGEGGRARMREMNQTAVEWSQTLLFSFNPKMSYVPQAWVDADPFWAPKPATTVKKPAEKK